MILGMNIVALDQAPGHSCVEVILS